jgi:hypothetical protein
MEKTVFVSTLQLTSLAHLICFYFPNILKAHLASMSASRAAISISNFFISASTASYKIINTGILEIVLPSEH